MSNSDTSGYVLRYNEISTQLEYAVGSTWVPIPTSTGVSSFNALTGAVVLAAGANITLTPSGNTITIASSGGGGSGTVTRFSAGALTPLFTTSVATATVTPALTFTLSTASANTIFGNCTTSTAVPAFCAL